MRTTGRGGWWSRVALATTLALPACNIGTSVDDIPSTARVRVEGSAPDELRLIVSADFIEQINLDTTERSVLLDHADTLAVELPYDETWDLNQFGSVYVELLYTPTSTASVVLRVSLDNGEAFERAANLSAGAQLIYYWIWSGQIG